MKKKLAIASIVLMATSLTACGGDGGDEDTAEDAASSTSVSADQSSASTTSISTEPSTTTSSSTEPSGASSSSEYCAKLSDAKADLDDLDLTGLGEDQFSDLQQTFGEVADAAPADIADDWATLNGALEDFKTLLNNAGLSLDDLQALTEDPSNLPDGVSLKKLQALGPKLEKFGDDGALEAAGDNISKNAQSACGIDLDG